MYRKKLCTAFLKEDYHFLALSQLPLEVYRFGRSEASTLYVSSYLIEVEKLKLVFASL